MTATETPTVSAWFRRARFWIAMGVLAVLGAIVLLALGGGVAASGEPLAADNAAPKGARALVEVLSNEGVEVTVATNYDEALAAAAGSTVFLHDAFPVLSEERVSALADASEAFVMVAPDFLTLGSLAPGVSFAGVAGDGELTAGCDLPAAMRAETISAGLESLHIGSSANGWTGCFASDDSTFALVTDGADRPKTIVGSRQIFANETIAEAGNAALALGLLGTNESLVWYVPGIADIESSDAGLDELVPGWLSPLLVLGICVAVAAMVWRGRRFGPLVIENLPVVVPARETTQGRARLYSRVGARSSALDNTRMATLARISTMLGLARSTPHDQVCRAIAVLVDQPIERVRHVLVDALPADDKELAQLSTDVIALEQSVRRSLGRTEPGDNT